MQSINPSVPWLDAGAALQLLGVRPQSLYASVSRGRIRSKPDPDDSRRSLYSRDDVLRLAARRAGAVPARDVALQAVAWGEPVLASGVSTVESGRLFYAGLAVEQLVREDAGLEAVAALLWGAPPVVFHAPAPCDATGGLGAALAAMAAATAAAAAAVECPPSHGRAVTEPHADAARLVASMAQAWLGGAEDAAPAPLHRRIADRWQRPLSADAMRRALVLLADHELNASTFAARVAASTGASLAAALLAGLATLTGPLHGGACADLFELLAQAQVHGAEAAVQARLRQGRPLPAFGHPLYPDGDERAALLLEACEMPPLLAELSAVVTRLTGSLPNVDFALAALTLVHAWPREAPLALFAIARSVGWIAHALEQQRSKVLIRPRAFYAGPALPALRATGRRGWATS